MRQEKEKERLSPAQVKFLKGFSGEGVVPGEWPGGREMARWMEGEKFRREYAAVRRALASEARVHALGQMVVEGRRVSRGGKKDAKEAKEAKNGDAAKEEERAVTAAERERVTRYWDRLNRGRGRRKAARGEEGEGDGDEGMTFEEVVRGFVPEGVDVGRAVEFFRRRAEEG